jgi:hypothetical protein
VALQVERHGRALVAEHLLNGVHIRAGRDGQGRGRVASSCGQRFGCSCQCGALECLRPHDGPLDAQAALRKDRADRERRLEGLAVALLIALGERDA